MNKYSIDSFIINDVDASNFAFDMDSTEIAVPTSAMNGYSNVIGEGIENIGACGVKPLGIGKKGKAKLAEWEECARKNQERKQEKRDLKLDQKKAKIDSMNADTSATKAGADATQALSKTDNQSGDSGVPTYVYYVVGGVLFLVIVFVAFKHFKTAGKIAPTPVAVK